MSIEAAIAEFRQFLEEAVHAPGPEVSVPYDMICRVVTLAVGKPAKIVASNPKAHRS